MFSVVVGSSGEVWSNRNMFSVFGGPVEKLKVTGIEDFFFYCWSLQSQEICFGPWSEGFKVPDSMAKLTKQLLTELCRLFYKCFQISFRQKSPKLLLQHITTWSSSQSINLKRSWTKQRQPIQGTNLKNKTTWNK